MTIQRCAHLKADDVAAPYNAMGIAMELCAECRAEMDERLGEKPLSGETPIEKAANGIPSCPICSGLKVKPNTVDSKGDVTSWLCADCVMWFDPKKQDRGVFDE